MNFWNKTIDRHVNAPVVINVCHDAFGLHHADDGQFGRVNGDGLPDGAFCAEQICGNA